MGINKDIYLKLEELAYDTGRNYKDLVVEFIKRRETIKECYGNKYIGRESHIPVLAYHGIRDKYIKHYPTLDDDLRVIF